MGQYDLGMKAAAENPVTRTAQLFDALSPSYDAVGVDFFAPIAEHLIEHLALSPGERLIDIGCGSGRVLLCAADRLGHGARLTGIDAAPGMIERTRSATTAAGLTNVELMVMDAQLPDLEPASFDVVAASLVLFFLPDPLAALRAWRGLLRPGGSVGITTFARQDPAWQDVDSVFDPYLPPGMLDARTSGARGPFSSDERLADLFHAADFSSVRSWHTTLDVVFDDVDHWHRWTMSVGQRAMWQAVPEEARTNVLGLASERLADSVGPDGRIHLRQEIRTTVAWNQ